MSHSKLAAVSMMLPLALWCSVAAAQEQQTDCVVNATSQSVAQTQRLHLLFAIPPGDVYGPYVPYTGPLLDIASSEFSSAPSKVCAPSNVQTASNNSSQRMPQPKPELQKEEVYGSYVPYKAPVAATPPQSEVVDVQPPPCYTASAQLVHSASQLASASLNPQPQPQPDEVYGPYVPYVPPTQSVAVPKVETAAVQPPACVTLTVETASNTKQPTSLLSVGQPQHEEVYGPYVPYVAPISSAFAPKLQAVATSSVACDPGITQTAHNDPPVLSAAPAIAPTLGAVSSTSEFVRLAPPPLAAKEPRPIRPFRSVAFGLKANTLGAGAELATPMAHNFNLRSSINAFAFDYPFSIDGLNYDARFHFKSSETVVDWFPLHGSFHISPGVLYFKNALTATTVVGPGKSFTLGSQPFVNSVDDPVRGNATVIFPRKIAPMLLFGFGNIIPRSGRHLSFPIEFGAAYTGAGQISVKLVGTACTPQGCANFATNVEAQNHLKQEVHDLNEDLKRFPIFPIVSFGIAYHF
ncbi:MAG: hypothetical protein ABI286_01425 [Edaphobacter sp.]